MRIYDLYLASLAVVFMLTTVTLSIYEGASLDLYFSVYLIGYLAVTSLFVYLAPKAQRISDIAGYVLFVGFALIVANRVVAILLGRTLW